MIAKEATIKLNKNQNQNTRLKINMGMRLNLKMIKGRKPEENRRSIKIFMTMISFLGRAKSSGSLR